jgi:hypothetical protein
LLTKVFTVGLADFGCSETPARRGIQDPKFFLANNVGCFKFDV